MTKAKAYEVLELLSTASEEDIKKSFKRLAIKWHPDKNPTNPQESEEKFKEVLEAKDTLLSKNKTESEPNFDDPHSIFDSLFGEIFRGGNRGYSYFGPRPSRGEDLHCTLTITLEEAVAGCSQRFTTSRLVKCQSCKGKGGSGDQQCEYCNGHGNLSEKRGAFEFASICIACSGQGSKVKDKCSSCHGEGRVSNTETVRVDLKPGTEQGFTMMQRNSGHAGKEGAKNGDFYIHVSVRMHPRFTRIGNDLEMKLPISFALAALGGEVRIPTLLGEDVVMKLPPGTQPGAKLTLAGKGVKTDGRIRGSQIISVEIEIPKTLTEKQKQLLQDYMKESENDVRKDSRRSNRSGAE